MDESLHNTYSINLEQTFLSNLLILRNIQYDIYYNHNDKDIKCNFFITAFAIHLMCAMGVGAGSHRMWTHRSFKARMPLRIVLMIWQTMAFQVHLTTTLNTFFFFKYKCYLLQVSHNLIKVE